MIPPKPSFRKCFKCGKTFVYAPKSDALTYKDSLCKKCGGRKKRNYRRYNGQYIGNN